MKEGAEVINFSGYIENVRKGVNTADLNKHAQQFAEELKQMNLAFLKSINTQVSEKELGDEISPRASVALSDAMNDMIASDILLCNTVQEMQRVTQFYAQVALESAKKSDFQSAFGILNTLQANSQVDRLGIEKSPETVKILAEVDQILNGEKRLNNYRQIFNNYEGNHDMVPVLSDVKQKYNFAREQRSDDPEENEKISIEINRLKTQLQRCINASNPQNDQKNVAAKLNEPRLTTDTYFLNTEKAVPRPDSLEGRSRALKMPQKALDMQGGAAQKSTLEINSLFEASKQLSQLGVSNETISAIQYIKGRIQDELPTMLREATEQAKSNPTAKNKAHLSEIKSISKNFESYCGKKLCEIINGEFNKQISNAADFNEKSKIYKMQQKSYETAFRFTGIDINRDNQKLIQSEINKCQAQVAAAEPILKLPEETPKQIASDLMTKSLKIMAKISSSEIINNTWSEPNSNLQKLADYTSNLTKRVRDSVLLADSKAEQIKVFKTMTKVMDESIKAGDINTAMAIYYGLDNVPLNRLKYLIDDRSTAASYQKAVDFFTPNNNAKNVREYSKKLASEGKPVIPPVPLFTKDLTFARDGNRDLNFKLTQDGETIISNIYADFVSSQAANSAVLANSPAKPVADLEKWLSTPTLSEKASDARSAAIMPRGEKQKPYQTAIPTGMQVLNDYMKADLQAKAAAQQPQAAAPVPAAAPQPQAAPSIPAPLPSKKEKERVISDKGKEDEVASPTNDRINNMRAYLRNEFNSPIANAPKDNMEKIQVDMGGHLAHIEHRITEIEEILRQGVDSLSSEQGAALKGERSELISAKENLQNQMHAVGIIISEYKELDKLQNAPAVRIPDPLPRPAAAPANNADKGKQNAEAKGNEEKSAQVNKPSDKGKDVEVARVAKTENAPVSLRTKIYQAKLDRFLEKHGIQKDATPAEVTRKLTDKTFTFEKEIQEAVNAAVNDKSLKSGISQKEVAELQAGLRKHIKEKISPKDLNAAYKEYKEGAEATLKYISIKLHMGNDSKEAKKERLDRYKAQTSGIQNIDDFFENTIMQRVITAYSVQSGALKDQAPDVKLSKVAAQEAPAASVPAAPSPQAADPLKPFDDLKQATTVLQTEALQNALTNAFARKNPPPIPKVTANESGTLEFNVHQSSYFQAIKKVLDKMTIPYEVDDQKRGFKIKPDDLFAKGVSLDELATNIKQTRQTIRRENYLARRKTVVDGVLQPEAAKPAEAKPVEPANAAKATALPNKPQAEEKPEVKRRKIKVKAKVKEDRMPTQAPPAVPNIPESIQNAIKDVNLETVADKVKQNQAAESAPKRRVGFAEQVEIHNIPIVGKGKPVPEAVQHIGKKEFTAEELAQRAQGNEKEQKDAERKGRHAHRAALRADKQPKAPPPPIPDSSTTPPPVPPRLSDAVQQAIVEKVAAEIAPVPNTGPPPSAVSKAATASPESLAKILSAPMPIKVEPLESVVQPKKGFGDEPRPRVAAKQNAALQKGQEAAPAAPKPDVLSSYKAAQKGNVLNTGAGSMWKKLDEQAKETNATKPIKPK